jgi:hypothetical protein
MAMLDQPMEGPSVWKGADLRQSGDWLTPLNAADIREIEGAVHSVTQRGVPLFEVTSDDFPLPSLGQRMAAIARVLEGGRGFAVLRGLPITRYDLDAARLIIWGLATHLGTPEPQDGKGSLMHSVTDTGKEVEVNESNRGYETDDELKFHNDGGDVFMLLCLRTALSGGISKLVSVGALFNEVLRRRPDLAAVLQEPFHFDARSQNPLGIRVQSVPIFNYHEGHLSALYKRRHITLAQRFPEVPRLTELQMEALDLLDELCNDPDMHLSFSMHPGDIQIGNNYSILHSRTKYNDHVEPERKRHLLRVWLSLRDARPLPAIFEKTREFGPTYARRVKDGKVAAAGTSVIGI